MDFHTSGVDMAWWFSRPSRTGRHECGGVATARLIGRDKHKTGNVGSLTYTKAMRGEAHAIDTRQTLRENLTRIVDPTAEHSGVQHNIRFMNTAGKTKRGENDFGDY